MSSGEREYFGLRLGLWYATLFILGSLIIVYLAYYVMSTSLAERDAQIIQSKLGEYATVYRRGGLRALADTVRLEQLTAPERLYVRVLGRDAEVLVLSNREGWDPDPRESGWLTFPDGALDAIGYGRVSGRH